ncbi:DUF397 domain-containing protein [Streptomyces sp. NPDC054865]
MIINTHASTSGDIPEGAWHKSSYSNDTGGACVEVAAAASVFVRDSKDTTRDGLSVSPRTWGTFVAFAKGLDR